MNKKRILLSLAVIGAVVAGVAWGTNALFTSEETSTGNTFSTGGVNLRIDNVSHYNGLACAEIGVGTGVYQWVPSTIPPEWAYDQDFHPFAANFTPAEAATWNADHPAGYPLAGDPCTGTWPIKDLNLEKIFNFLDIKPGDRGEDTLSLHIEDNDVWGCVGVSNVFDLDPTQTQPESLVDTDSTVSGELAENMYFFAWDDDGDNVYEVNEAPLTPNPVKGSDISADTWALADSTTGGVPLASGVTHFVGIAWCAGQMTVDHNTHVVTCSNETMGNEAQTDTFQADVKFTVVQSRNNENFVCGQGNEEPEMGNIVVIKQTDPTGDQTVFNFTASYDGDGFALSDGGQNDSGSLSPGAYSVAETVPTDWTLTSSDCVSSIDDTETANDLELDAGETITCTFVNTYVEACLDQADVMLVLDRSGSISGSEMTSLKNAANAFMTALAPNGGVHMGQSSFSTTGTLDLQLTGDQSLIAAAINALAPGGYTNLFSGLDLANTELETGVAERPLTPDYMVVITDGNPNEPGSDSNARAVALAEATAAQGAGVTIFVVGVGSDVNAAYLQTIASPGKYYGIANYTDLEAVLHAIATCQQPN